MRIDLEQFMALTVALGTVGAVGTAVYMTRADAQEAAATQAAEEAAPDEEEELPEAPPDPEPEPEPVAEPTPEVVDTVLPADEDLSNVPAPYSEGAWMNS